MKNRDFFIVQVIGNVRNRQTKNMIFNFLYRIFEICTRCLITVVEKVDNLVNNLF